VGHEGDEGNGTCLAHGGHVLTEPGEELAQDHLGEGRRVVELEDVGEGQTGLGAHSIVRVAREALRKGLQHRGRMGSVGLAVKVWGNAGEDLG
jgi:hypothetical protein